MDNIDRTKTSAADADREYVRGGKGRKDEVGRSGIYPASAPDAPADSEIIGQEELGRGRKDEAVVPTEPQQKEGD